MIRNGYIDSHNMTVDHQMSEQVVHQTSSEEINRIFRLQQEYALTLGKTSVSERIKKLKRLLKVLSKYRNEIQETLYKEYGKPSAEVDVVEYFLLSSEIKFVCRNLKQWMRPKRVETSLALLGTSSHIRYESKGVSLIIAPWNFPLQLAIGPLISAIAAGCTAMIKPSEMTPLVASLIKRMLGEIFEEKEVAVIEGGVEVSTHLLSKAFNHIFFTGSSQVGKIIMKAAAEHLSSVTLELGGKSPVIVDQSASVKTAAYKTARAKFVNNGQICIAPDYVLIHESIAEEFVAFLEEAILEYFGPEAKDSKSYARIINSRHFSRLSETLDDALTSGAQIAIGGDRDENENYISPTVLVDLDLKSRIMNEEVFGPILPIVQFKDIEEATELINKKDRPLALYIFSKSKKNTRYYLDNTRAGGGCINNAAVHFYNHELPFGGSNASGIGRAHGHYGFLAFSNERAIMKQDFPGAMDLLGPPYTSWKQKIIDLAINWF